MVRVRVRVRVKVRVRDRVRVRVRARVAFFQLLACASVTEPSLSTLRARSDCGAPHAASILATASGGKRVSFGATLAAVTW